MKTLLSLIVYPSMSPWAHMGCKGTEATGGTGGAISLLACMSLTSLSSLVSLQLIPPRLRKCCHGRFASDTILAALRKPIQQIQVLLGHSNVETIMIYTHVAKGMRAAVRSTLAQLAYTLHYVLNQSHTLQSVRLALEHVIPRVVSRKGR